MPENDLVLEFTSFREVLDGYAERLSEEGICFTTAEPRAVGSEVAFHVRIQDGFSVLKGTGEVVQSSAEGLFVRLTDLDQPSLKLLPKLLEHYRRKGVPLMELPSVAAVAAEAEDRPAENSVPAGIDIERLEGSRDNALVDQDPPAEPEDGTVPHGEIAVDDLFDSDGAEAEPARTPGLTLDDLEAEFRAVPTSDESAAAIDSDLDSAVEEQLSPPDVGALLLEAEDLADRPLDGQAVLQVAEPLAPDIEVVTSRPSPEVDAGLPWLPEEPEKSGKKDLWVILLLVLLGAALGAIFYVFVIRPSAQSSRRPSPSAPVQAQAVPASSQVATGMAPPASAEGVAEASAKGVGIEATPVEEAVEEPVRATAAQQPLTGVDRITWGDETGATVVTLWADGAFQSEQIDDFRVDGVQPREVVRIRGVQRPFAQHLIELETEHVLQIRTGLHEENGVNSLHIVADLVDVEVELLRTEATGEQLRVYFSRTG